MKTEHIIIVVMMIVAACLLYYGYNTFIKNKDLKNRAFKSGIDVNALLEALGGKNNILNVTSSPSKLTVTLKDHALVQIESIKALGSTGIVQGKETLSMIFGRQASLIAEDLNTLL